MPRRLLIVDDNCVERAMLSEILGGSYNITEADSGKQALSVLSICYQELSAVMIDIMMPEMDGFELLKSIRKNALWAQIPVIVATSLSDSDTMIKAVTYGANNFITKPFNPVLIQATVKNCVALRENASIVNQMQYDSLTGIYNRDTFMKEAYKLIHKNSPGHYIMASFDIDGFKIINDLYGVKTGDRVLKHIGCVFKNGFEPHGGIACRVAADQFIILYPASFHNSRELEEIRTRASHIEGLIEPVIFTVGRYLVEDINLPVNVMYDRAIMASDFIKGRYDLKSAFYTDSMREHLILEQRIVSQMETALKEEQFEVWFQPQYNYFTKAMIGAEALVRWRHPENGLYTPPGDFIPVFERNGFIYELDKYVWEKVCANLRLWIDEGRKPLPLSVNISRQDIFHNDIVDIILGLTEKYKIPYDLLRLEITESAFAKSTKQIVCVVEQLIEHGFTVEIDDFGSGYSSLNTLKEVPAQIVKIDMKFLEINGNPGRGGSIIESVVRMTKWLGMSVIAEGVETAEQADYLLSVGCTYMQGYLFAKPMPVNEYLEHSAVSGSEHMLNGLEAVANLDTNLFWDPKSMETLIFNSYVGGACIFEYHNGSIELLRFNKKYAETVCPGLSNEEIFRKSTLENMDIRNRELLKSSILKAIESCDEIVCETVESCLDNGGKDIYIHSAMRVIARSGNHYLIYSTVVNVTAQREAEKQTRVLSEQMQSVLSSMSNGITATVLRDGKTELIFSNDRFYEMRGYTRAQYRAEVGDFLSIVHPDDRERVRLSSVNASAPGKTEKVEYRLIRRDKSERIFRANMTTTVFTGISLPVTICLYNDITGEKEAERLKTDLLDNLPSGAGLYEYDGKTLTLIHQNKRYWECVKRKPGADLTPFTDSIHPDDRLYVYREITAAIDEKRDISCDMRILYGKDEYRMFHISGRIIKKADGKYLIYTVYTDEDEQRRILSRLHTGEN